MEPETLLFQTSPLGNVDAIVQHDHRCVYFFLHENPKSVFGSPKFGTRSVWVQNLEQGPLVIDRASLEKGLPVVLPRTHTIHRAGLPLPEPDRLAVVWFEEGNGAALVETDAGSNSVFVRALAVIPPWSGTDGFHGYASECATENEVCWPLPKNNALNRRIENAQDFWQQFESGNSPFATIQPTQLRYYHRRFQSKPITETRDDEQPQNYFSIDGGKFPPRGLQQFDLEDSVVLVTVGMGLLPQPMVELATDNPGRFRRIELGLKIPRRVASEALVDQARKKISQMAAYPWSNLTWLGSGHSCSFSGVFEGRDHALLIDDSLVRTESEAPLPAFRDDPVNLLWIAPATKEEVDNLSNTMLSKAQAKDLLNRL